MKLMNSYTGKIHLLLLVLIVALLSNCSSNEPTSGETGAAEQNAHEKSAFKTASDIGIAVEAPPLTDGIFPCNDCHSEIESNPERRELVDMHDDITALFNHDSENRWCLDCHDASNRDSLRLASGKLLDFKESYKLCGQCHGEKLRDWKVGVHGKRTGDWNGKKEYLLCVHCHNPHAPKFEAITPEPPPVMQENISYKNNKSDEQ